MLPGTEINFNIDLCIFNKKKNFLPQRTILIKFKQKRVCKRDRSIGIQCKASC